MAVVRDQKLRNSSKSLKRLFFEDSNQKIRNPLLIQQLLEFEIPQPDIFLCFTYLVQNPFSDDCTTLEIVNYFLETLLKKKWQSLLRKRNAKEIQYLIGSDPESAITVQGLGNSTLYSMILLNGPPSLIDNDFLKHSFRIRGSGWVCLIALISLFIYGLTSTYIVFGLLRSPNTPPLLTKAIDNQLLDDQFSGTQKSESLTWFLETLIPKLFNTDVSLTFAV